MCCFSKIWEVVEGLHSSHSSYTIAGAEQRPVVESRCEDDNTGAFRVLAAVQGVRWGREIHDLLQGKSYTILTYSTHLFHVLKVNIEIFLLHASSKNCCNNPKIVLACCSYSYLFCTKKEIYPALAFVTVHNVFVWGFCRKNRILSLVVTCYR